MRQKDDILFCIALTHFGEGNMTDTDLKLFNSRNFEKKMKNTIHLFVIFDYKSVNTHNFNILNKIDSQLLESLAIDTVKDTRSDTEKNKILETHKKKTQNANSRIIIQFIAQRNQQLHDI